MCSAEMPGNGTRNQDVEGPPTDTILIKVPAHDGVLTPLLNRYNLKSDTLFWLYTPPVLIFSPEHILAITGGDTSCVALYESSIMRWCTCAQYLINDFHFVLGMEYHKFWSTVLFDDNFSIALESVLRQSPRWFDANYLVTPLMQSLQNELHEVVIKIIMRMSIWRESKTEHLTPATFADYLYDSVYDIARVVDICVLYGYTEKSSVNPLIKKMLTNVFKRQPKLTLEVDIFVGAIQKILSDLRGICENEDPDVSRGELLLHMGGTSLNSTPFEFLDDKEIFDMCQRTLEPSATVLHFMRHTPDEILDSLEDVVIAIPQFFDVVYTSIDRELERRKGTLPTGLADQAMEMFRAGQSCALDVFRHFVKVKCIDPTATNSLPNTEAALKAVEKYYTLLMQAVEQASFIISYNSMYPLQEDIDTFRKSSLTAGLVDESQFKYLLNALHMAVTEIGLEQDVFGESVMLEGAVGGSMMSEVKKILAVIPDLRHEFVEKCLEFYDWNVNEVISALIDNNVHPELEKYRHAPAKSVEESPKAEDGAEVHIGKKNQLACLFTEDFLAKRNVQNIIMQYSDVDVEVNTKMYDDEYDDTYDSVDVGIPEKDFRESDRPFEVPRILRKGDERRKAEWEIGKNQEENDDSDDNEDDDATRKRQIAFCENPEDVRARREQRYQANLARRGKAPPPKRDVVGVAKGQGQSREVLRNRQLKEKHKGGNRAVQSERKRREF
ncbi:activating signal cointegrator 1 complex subunit 2-like [Varroa jacobsoni]|uniref:activating signal cointegrator 1 complex subunit 2-like n=1 Tax=Varroa jacobsoni TaxID=62625 RepID=UPI000BF60322|nr:activating signal cointegrator 1 complex subunit 2-like [Varroa jacobsoni]